MVKQNSTIVSKFLIIFFGLFFVQNLFKLPLIELFGLRDIRSESFMFYQIFTHIFIHSSLGHLLRNAFGFWLFGQRLEKILGKKYFLILIILSGLGSALLQSYTNYINISKIQEKSLEYYSAPSPEKFNEFMNNFPSNLKRKYKVFIDMYERNPKNVTYIVESKKIIKSLYNFRLETPSVGASGILFGFLAGFTILFPNELLIIIFFPIPIKAKYLTLLYGLYELYEGSRNNPADNVGHFAHLGGLVLGYLFMRWWKKNILKGFK
ncbi:MAG: rhomboid family intramembrane serine protease [Bacteroidetes bacterium]|nr:rhomboid family intramembrane serine protease [Bacteroidota bacterium]